VALVQQPAPAIGRGVLGLPADRLIVAGNRAIDVARRRRQIARVERGDRLVLLRLRHTTGQARAERQDRQGGERAPPPLARPQADAPAGALFHTIAIHPRPRSPATRRAPVVWSRPSLPRARATAG